MKRILFLLALAGAAQGALALQPFATVDAFASDDSDHNRVQTLSGGMGFYLDPKRNYFDRFGYRHGVHRFTSTGLGLRGQSDSLYAARAFDTPMGETRVDGEIGRLRIRDGHSHTVGHVQVAGKLGDPAAYELRYERNVVDAPTALAAGVDYGLWTLAGDYEVTPRASLSALLGHFSFSDGNRRPLLRLRGNYVLSEEHGVSAYVRTRSYRDSQAYNGLYFSPERFNEGLVGVQLRRRVPQIKGTLVAFAEYGRQFIDGTGSPAYGVGVRYESFVHHDWKLALGVGSQNTAGTGGGAGYRYNYLRASLLIPF